MIDNEVFWYAIRTRAKHEIIIRNFLRKIEIICYLPTFTEYRRYAHYRIKKIEKPIIGNLLFIKSSKVKIISILEEYGLKFTLIRDKSQEVIRIPEKQMEDFIRMVDTMKEKIDVDAETFISGDKVRVTEGPLAGIEGELIKKNGRHHLVIRIQDVATVSVKVSKKTVIKIASVSTYSSGTDKVYK